MIKRSAFCLDREGWPAQYSGREVDAATDTGLFVTGSKFWFSYAPSLDELHYPHIRRCLQQPVGANDERPARQRGDKCHDKVS